MPTKQLQLRTDDALLGQIGDQLVLEEVWIDRFSMPAANAYGLTTCRMRRVE
jgi:hypothetical protein